MTRTIEYEEIKTIMPHRYPFLLVDRVTHYEDDKYIEAYKNVTGNEPFFQGHFPEKSVMPGVLVIEAMAQAGGILLLKRKKGTGGLVYFTAIEKARFRQPVVPGDQLRFEVTVLRLKSSYCKLSGKAFVDDKLVAEAVFSSALSVT